MIAAWSDVTNALSDTSSLSGSHVGLTSLQDVTDVVYKLNIGYFWMLINCLTSAAYVSAAVCQAFICSIFAQVLTMRKRIKATGFTDWDSMFYSNLLSIPILAVFSFVAEDWGTENLNRNL